MPMTNAQKAKRLADQKKGIVFASDVAKILNVSPWGNSADYYHSVVDGVDFDTGLNQSAEIGNWLEDAVLDYWSDKNNIKVKRNPGKRRRDCMACHPDAIFVDNKDEHAQVKTAGIVNPFAIGEEWGEDGSDDIPVYYIIQVQAEMFVLNTKVCHIPALIGGRGWRHYVIHRHDAMVQSIYQQVSRFVDHHIKLKTAPLEVVPHLDTLKHMPRTVKRIPPNDDTNKLVAAWEQSREQRLAYEKGGDAFLRDILHTLGDADAADLGDGREFCYLEQKSSPSYDHAAMVEDGIDIDKYKRLGSHRVARVRKIPKTKTKGA
jgi:hypothetical protein